MEQVLVWTLCIISVVAVLMVPICALIAKAAFSRLLSFQQETFSLGGTPMGLVRKQHELQHDMDTKHIDLEHAKLELMKQTDDALEQQQVEKVFS